MDKRKRSQLEDDSSVVPRQRCPGIRGRQSPFSSMSRFNLDFRESKPKFLSPNSFSTMAEITPSTSLVVEHNTNSRTVIQIIKKQRKGR
ncbi:unnamed protein product [Boreogadus saida]